MTLGVRNRLPLLPINVAIIAIVLFTYTGEVKSAGQQYVGKFLGKLSELHHGVSGEVYAVDGRTLHIKDFTYDGQGPAAYFYAGNSKEPSNLGGFRVPDERGSTGVLKRYRKHSITLALPDGKTLNNIKWFSVWCDEFSVNFGDIRVPRNFEYPKPQKIDPLNGVHNIASDNIVIVDAQTLLVPNLSYDGEAPDAKFWVGRGPKPSPQGIRVPDENGKEIPLRRYDRKTVVLTLPQDLTVFDIGHFGIWCEAFTVDFGHVQIPSNLNVPPSLKMLGISPQKRASPFLSPETQSVAPLAQAHVYPQQGQLLAATTYRPPQFERFHTQQTQHISHRQPFAFAQQNYFNRRLDTNQLPANNNNNVHYQQQQQQHNQQLIYNQQLVPQPTNNVLFYQQNQLNNQHLYNNNPQLQTQQTIYNQQRFNNQQQLLYEQQLLSARQQREYQLERQRLHNNQALQLQNHLAQSSNRFDVVQQPNYFVQFG